MSEKVSVSESAQKFFALFEEHLDIPFDSYFSIHDVVDAYHWAVVLKGDEATIDDMVDELFDILRNNLERRLIHGEQPKHHD